MRIGFGYDVHRFDENRQLVLCGISIPDHAGLAGHSDADAPVHALIDALLGAACLGDIGEHFPDSDDRYKNASSLSLLAVTMDNVRAAGFTLNNADVTIAAESPKIRPLAAAMRASLAEVLGIDVCRISVKGKSEEKLGFTGSGAGLKAWAVCLIDENSKQPVSRPGKKTAEY